MKDLCQRDKKWGSIKLGTSSLTIANYGCFITSLAMLAYLTPDVVNAKLLEEKGYFKDCLVDSVKAAKILGLKYNGKILAENAVFPRKVCIAEVDFQPATTAKDQHFVVWLGYEINEDWQIKDPWTGKNEGISKYKGKLTSFRLFEEKSIDYKAKFDDLRPLISSIHDNYQVQSSLRLEALNLVSQLKSVYSVLTVNELDKNMQEQTELRAKEKDIIDNLLKFKYF